MHLCFGGMQVQTEAKDFKVAAESEHEAVEWLDAIQGCIDDYEMRQYALYIIIIVTPHVPVDDLCLY